MKRVLKQCNLFLLAFAMVLGLMLDMSTIAKAGMIGNIPFMSIRKLETGENFGDSYYIWYRNSLSKEEYVTAIEYCFQQAPVTGDAIIVGQNSFGFKVFIYRNGEWVYTTRTRRQLVEAITSAKPGSQASVWLLEESQREITPARFPSYGFRKYLAEVVQLSEFIEDQGNGEYNTFGRADVNAMVGMYLEEEAAAYQISSLEGIQYFREMKELVVKGQGNLAGFDISKLEKLDTFVCEGNYCVVPVGKNITGDYVVSTADFAGFSMDSVADVNGASISGTSFVTNDDMVLTKGSDMPYFTYKYYCGNEGDESKAATFTIYLDTDVVAINEVNFPDEAFRAYIETYCDTDAPKGILTKEEIAKVTAMSVTGVESLQGLEYFTELLNFQVVYSPNLTSVDISKNTKLVTLTMNVTGVSALDMSKNKDLQVVDLDYNCLYGLYFEGLNIQAFHCEKNYYNYILGAPKNGKYSIDLSTIPNLDLERVVSVEDATLNGTIASCSADKDYIDIDYDCGDHYTAGIRVNLIEQAVLINETNFPDENFRQFVSDFFDWRDAVKGVLSKKEVVYDDGILQINLEDYEIHSLKGIEYLQFEGIEIIGEPLKTLDLSKNTGVVDISIYNSSLDELILPKDNKTVYLTIDNTRLACLDLTKYTNLDIVSIKNNERSLSAPKNSEGSFVFDLRTIPGFDVSKMSNLVGGTVKGTILTTTPGNNRVTYDYCYRVVDGIRDTGEFSLLFSEGAGLVIGVQPQNQSVTAGTVVTFKVEASGNGLTYQWKKSTDGGKTWVNSTSTGATTDTLKMTAKASFNNYLFKCVVTDEAGLQLESDAAKLTVSSSTATLAITTQPKSQTVETGTTVKFTVVATGSNLKYQWKISKDGGATWSNSGSTGATTATLSMTAKLAFNGYQFKCVVTDGTGKSVTSNVAKLTVTAAATAPKITTQPKSQTVATGTAVKFTIAATGTNCKYQWKISKDGGATWSNSGSTGATTATLSMTAKLAFNGYQFKCVVTDSNGKSVESAVATLTVTAAVKATAITKQPVDVTVETMANATFTIGATGEELTYQWKISKDGGASWSNSSSTGAKTASLTISTRLTMDGYKVKCIVTGKDGKSIESNVVTLTVTK